MTHILKLLFLVLTIPIYGNTVLINKLTTEQGFPIDIFDLERHRENPITLKDVEGKIFEFAALKPVRASASPIIHKLAFSICGTEER